MQENKENEYMKFAVELGKETGQLLMDFFGRRLDPIWTSPTHFKTAADDKIDGLIRERINKRFPDHDILSEEGLPKKSQSEYTWVIDAVDGTIGLRTGITDHFGVCIGLCRSKTPILGVINMPKRGELCSAELGKGAFCNGSLIRVSNLTNINQVIMGVDSGKYGRTKHLPYLKKLLSSDGIACPITTGSASVQLCLVASGVMNAYLATSLEPEDMTAVVVIIREAGGKVSNLKGEEWQLGDKSILAANPVLHRKLFEFLS